ncbi:MAG: hypothetical protein JJU34_06455 [Lunatimonas sp.]|uniref:AbiU2 domain-containing protein n=1 Tax=Lunatimonas sp. TaxID=2060141 RepID=UPI00263BBB7A|nr:hypothetical protein [Lunatimonas sp.]MCC5936903.1 hypothetical protein [Lunatimonas sp.]
MTNHRQGQSPLNPLEIKEWLDDLRNILFDLNICLDNVKRLSMLKYEQEEWVKGHGFFDLYMHQLRFIIVIQLSKLIADNKRTHKRNFFHLCEKLELMDLNGDFLKELRKYQPDSRFELESTQQSIDVLTENVKEKLNRHRFQIESIVKARDQIYAHNDPNSNKKVPVIRDLEIMILLCNEVFNGFTGELFKSHTEFSRTTGWDIDFILKEMSARRKLKLEERPLRGNV